MGKGGGSPAPAPSQQTVTQTSIPEYARPYVENMLGKSEALTDINANPYQAYGGQRIQDFTPMQQQAFQGVGNMQVAPEIGAGSNLAALSGLAIIFAIVASRYRDLPQIINAVLTVGFYLTPVIWVKESLGNAELVNSIVNVNPFYHILSVARLPLIGQYPSVENWIWVFALAAFFWMVGLLLFRRYEKRIAYWV